MQPKLKKQTLVAIAIVAAPMMLIVSAAAIAEEKSSWISLLNDAYLSLAQGRKANALTTFKEAMSSAGDTYAKIETRRALIGVDEELEQFKEAEYLLRECFAFKTSMRCLQESLLSDCGELYELEGKAALAKTMQKQCEAMKKEDASFSKGETFADYKTQIDSLIREKRLPKWNGSSKTATVSWLVDATGKFSLAHISKSSGDADYDDYVLDTVQKVSGQRKRPNHGKLNGLATMQFKMTNEEAAVQPKAQ